MGVSRKHYIATSSNYCHFFSLSNAQITLDVTATKRVLEAA